MKAKYNTMPYDGRYQFYHPHHYILLKKAQFLHKKDFNINVCIFVFLQFFFFCKQILLNIKEK
jgi:hypothetical protein